MQAAVSWHCDAGPWGHEGAWLLTLTVRHREGDDLAALVRGLADAFKRLVNGAPWKRFCARVGIVGFVRALEVTHGANGWHPHLHAVLLVRDPAALAGEIEWLRTRWHDCVVEVLGNKAEPNGHGVDLRPCRHANYLAKLGLEVTAPGEKRARGTSRTPWEILADIGASPAPDDKRSPDEIDADRARDVGLWQTWEKAMRGRKMLTWSKGLRAAAKLGRERDDEEIVEDNEKGVPVVFLRAETWDRVRDVRGLPAALLTACERGGPPAVEAMLVQYLGPPPEAEAAQEEAARAGS